MKAGQDKIDEAMLELGGLLERARDIDAGCFTFDISLGEVKRKARTILKRHFGQKYRERVTTPAVLEAKRVKLMDRITEYVCSYGIGLVSTGDGDLTQLERVLYILYCAYKRSTLFSVEAPLLSGYVSAAFFLKHYIKAYAQRVYDLRELGFKIDSERCPDKPYGHYRLMAWEKPVQRALGV